MTLVLEGQARTGADESDVDGVAVAHAPGEGDDTIAAIAETHREVVVVTADRELAERVRAANGKVVPSWLLDQLVDASRFLRGIDEPFRVSDVDGEQIEKIDAFAHVNFMESCETPDDVG